MAIVASCACRRGSNEGASSVDVPAVAPAPKRVRPPAAAGQFYPADADALRAAVSKVLNAAPRVVTGRASIVLTPHAALTYSGGIAGKAFRQLDAGFSRAVIIAGNHNGEARYAGVSVERSTHWRMPGLEVRVSPAAADLLGRANFVDVPEAHTMYMIEIELPFLSAVNSGRPFEIVPLVAGTLPRSATRDVAHELARLADATTVFVFSVDLSHYYTWDQAVALDQACLSALERMDADGVARCDTDATQVLMVMTELAAGLGLSPRRIDYANSGDVTGDKTRVVGYGAMAYEDAFQLGPPERAALLALARDSMAAYVRDGRTPAVPDSLATRFPRLGAVRGAFVTLRKAGELRGCIGTLEAHRPLAQDVAENAVNAAVHDGRFPPVRADEIPNIDLSISVLDTPRPLSDASLRGDALTAWLGLKHPGLIISFHGRRSTFLPEVWDEIPESGQFLQALCLKQGSPPSCWRDSDAAFQIYGVQHFAEK
jgi:hypothetical protein